MKAHRTALIACLVVVTALVGVGAVWLWNGGTPGRSHVRSSPSPAVQSVPSAGASASLSSAASTPAASPSPTQCERYLHASNLDAGCLEPSGALMATIDSQALDTTGAHVTCQLDGHRLEVSVDTLERLHDEGSFWAVLWGEGTRFDVLEMGIGYGRHGADGDPADAVVYRLDDSGRHRAPSVSRDGRTLTITGALTPIMKETPVPVTMSVTCPADF